MFHFGFSILLRHELVRCGESKCMDKKGQVSLEALIIGVVLIAAAGLFMTMVQHQATAMSGALNSTAGNVIAKMNWTG